MNVREQHTVPVGGSEVWTDPSSAKRRGVLGDCMGFGFIVPNIIVMIFGT